MAGSLQEGGLVGPLVASWQHAEQRVQHGRCRFGAVLDPVAQRAAQALHAAVVAARCVKAALQQDVGGG